VSNRPAAFLRPDRRPAYREAAFVAVEDIARSQNQAPPHAPSSTVADDRLDGGWLRRLSADPRARFLVAGGFATLVNWLIRFPLDVVLPYAGAVALAAVAHMVCSFMLYRSWVFPGSQRRLAEQVRDFVLVNLVGMAVTVGISVFLRQVLVSLSAEPWIAAAGAHIVGIASGAVAGYLGHGRVTFR
jgi:energy-coupling factor transport system substrate-specific component